MHPIIAEPSVGTTESKILSNFKYLAFSETSDITLLAL